MQNNLYDSKLPRMRTINEAFEEIKAVDNKSAISLHYIRQLVLQGVLPRIKAGRKYLINLDLLIEFLQNPEDEKFKVNKPASNNAIRQIN